jgi:hypothetical protein
MYLVPSDYDRTPSEMKPLDDYILDVPVVIVIQYIFELPFPPHEWPTWAKNNLEEAPRFFSRPYCKAAARMLGYADSATKDQKGGEYAPRFFLSSKECINESAPNKPVNCIDNEDTRHEK